MNRYVLPWVILWSGSCGGAAPQKEPMEDLPDRFTTIRMPSEADGSREEQAPAPAPSAKAGDEGEAGGPPADVVGGVLAEPEEPEADSATQTARDWFPDAFLWAPRLVTDAQGLAEVQVVVPDTLTTWRVLALAHTADGQQAGALHSFIGSLPSWLELNTPPVLTEGDRVRLPLQVVHEGEGLLTGRVLVQAHGAAEDAAFFDVRLESGARSVQAVPIVVSRQGSLRIEASLEGVDALAREITVRPAGRPLVDRRGGLVTERVGLPLVEEAGDLGSTLDVWVFAGPLDVLRRELERLSQSELPWSGAYGWSLADHIATLAASSGASIDEAALRRLRIRAWQRLRSTAQAPEGGTAAELLLALRDSGGSAEIDALVRRLVRTVEEAQRGDGTWARSDAQPLQQVLVHTAATARALPEGSRGARVKAAGALERFAREVRDPYTAAVVAASGLIAGERLESLRTMVREALVAQPDGTVAFTIEAGVLDGWGGTPRQAEALAWAALALAEDPVDVVGPVVATLLAGYDVPYGFGAGAANPLVVQALVEHLPTLDKPAAVSLWVDGAVVSRADLQVAGDGAPAVLHAEALPAGGQVEVVVEPAVPGLGWTAVHRRWVPWGEAGAPAGYAVRVIPPRLAVGERGLLEVQLEGPGGEVLTVDVGLPPGAEVDGSVGHDRLASIEVLGDRVRMTTHALGTGETITVRVPVRAGLAGELQSVPHVVVAGGEEVVMRPTVWVVR